MKLFLVLALAVASASAASIDTILQPGFPTGRIINGYEASPGEAPFIVSLNSSGHFCGGSLISEDCVMTAAHCLTASNFAVVAGLHSRNTEEDVQVREVTSRNQYVIHENYKGGVGPNDIGLIFLTKPFNLNAVSRNGIAPVAKVNLPTGKYETTGQGKLYGWGIDNSGYLPHVLQVLDTTIIGYAECKKKLPLFSPIAESNVCTHADGATDGPCNGDSGGPLVRVNPSGVEQVGIVSWGYTPCHASTYPGVFTSVESHADWIKGKLSAYRNKKF